MSIFSGIKTFFGKVGHVIEHLFGDASFEQTVQSTISYIAPLLVTLLQLTAGTATATKAAQIISTIKADLGTVATTVQMAKVTPGTPAAATLQQALASVQSNLQEILSDADIKSSTKAADITATIGLVSGEIDAILQNVVAPPATSSNQAISA